MKCSFNSQNQESPQEFNNRRNDSHKTVAGFINHQAPGAVEPAFDEETIATSTRLRRPWTMETRIVHPALKNPPSEPNRGKFGGVAVHLAAQPASALSNRYESRLQAPDQLDLNPLVPTRDSFLRTEPETAACDPWPSLANFPRPAPHDCHNSSLAVVSTSVDASEPVSLTFPPTAPPSLDEVFRLQYPRVVAVLARVTGDRARAEELASEVFCRLSARPALFRPEGNLEGWLYRTAVNLGLDALRMEARRRRNEQAAGVEAVRSAGAGDPLDELLRAERRARVQTVLAVLKPVSARLLLLRHAGLSYGELAGTLAINPASVGTLLARAAADFEKRYRSMYGGEI